MIISIKDKMLKETTLTHLILEKLNLEVIQSVILIARHFTMPSSSHCPQKKKNKPKSIQVVWGRNCCEKGEYKYFLKVLLPKGSIQKYTNAITINLFDLKYKLC